MRTPQVLSILVFVAGLTVLVMVDTTATAQYDTDPQVRSSPTPFLVPPFSSPLHVIPTQQDPASLSSNMNPVLPGEYTDVLQITFPTAAPEPVSAWRPPHYQAPWAPGPFDHFYFERPIAADQVNWPLEDYRYGGISEGSDIIHTGIDINAPLGTPILAAASGRVIWADYGLMTGRYNPDDPYGLAVAIRHEFGFENQRLYTLYAHTAKLNVTDGQLVRAGDIIGWIGLTGATTGPHLHFEIRLGENVYTATRNPELWLTPPQGWGILAGRVLETSGRPIVSRDIYIWSKAGEDKWTVRTYGLRSVNPDDHYQENMVLSDLPAGEYTIMVVHLGRRYYLDIEIFPGRVSYFSFFGRNGFSLSLPDSTIQQPFTPPSP